MKTLFYPKLAVNGMKKNKRLYLPYILTLVAMVMMMYITAYLARSENIANTNRGVYAQWCLWLGIIVIGIFSLIFLFYSYFVLIKNRGKEFGLYNILGMNKRNIARILLCESLSRLSYRFFADLPQEYSCHALLSCVCSDFSALNLSEICLSMQAQ